MSYPTDPQTCPIRGCRVLLKDGLVMCGGHWKVLPAKIRVQYLEDMRTYKSADVKRMATNRVINGVRARLGGRERWARGETLK